MAAPARHRLALRRPRQNTLGRALSVHDAAFGLMLRTPHMSAGAPLAPPLAVLVGPALFLAGLAAYAPSFAGLVLLGALVLYVAALTTLRLGAAVLAPRWSPRTPVSDAELPMISLIVALHDEAAILPALIDALERLDYPHDRREIILALEDHDHATRAAARALARRHPLRIVSLPPLGPTTKPRALNFALQAARGTLIAVYDAEDAPHRDQLRAAAEAMAADPGLGVVQAPLGWYNRRQNWLTGQFGLEYAAQFHALLPLYARLGWPLPLGGTSNIFRRAALEDVGGWDPFNVTEDADLGFRLARQGWRAGLIAPPTTEEAPAAVTPWVNQRSRWLKGHLITWLVHMRRPRALIAQAGWRGAASLHLTVFANVLSALVHGPSVLLGAVLAAMLALAGALPAALAGLAVTSLAYLAAMACAWRGARRAGFRAKPLALLTMPAYWLLQAPAALKALREMPRQPYLWDKTDHGHAFAWRDPPHDACDDARPDGGQRQRVRPRRLAQQPALKPAQAAPGAVDADRAV